MTPLTTSKPASLRRKNQGEVPIASTNAQKGATAVAAPDVSSMLSVNVFAAPEKALVGERPKAHPDWGPNPSWLMFGFPRR